MQIRHRILKLNNIQIKTKFACCGMLINHYHQNQVPGIYSRLFINKIAMKYN